MERDHLAAKLGFSEGIFMSVEYYKVEDGLALIARLTPSETYRVVNTEGGWFDGAGMCEAYFFNGEPGAEPITDAEALALAEGFGETLAPIDDLEKELSDTAVV